jgi:hypothetical protein
VFVAARFEYHDQAFACLARQDFQHQGQFFPALFGTPFLLQFSTSHENSSGRG